MTPVWIGSVIVAGVIADASEDEVLMQVNCVVDSLVDEARRLVVAVHHGTQPDQVLVVQLEQAIDLAAGRVDEDFDERQTTALSAAVVEATDVQVTVGPGSE